MKGDMGIPGNTGPAGPTGPPGKKGAKGEPGESIAAPSLLQPPKETTINESQTAILECSVNGNPLPKVEWSKLNSSLPDGRHVIERSGALILREVRPGDEGLYSCRAENMLGSASASAKLTVQCKLPLSFLFLHFSFRLYLISKLKKNRFDCLTPFVSTQTITFVECDEHFKGRLLYKTNFFSKWNFMSFT